MILCCHAKPWQTSDLRSLLPSTFSYHCNVVQDCFVLSVNCPGKNARYVSAIFFFTTQSKFRSCEQFYHYPTKVLVIVTSRGLFHLRRPYEYALFTAIFIVARKVPKRATFVCVNMQPRIMFLFVLTCHGPFSHGGPYRYSIFSHFQY
jgi:hypothetical protein